MRNFVQNGDIITISAPVDGVASGEPVLVGTLFGVATGAANSGENVELALTGVYDLPKATGAITMGAALFFDSEVGQLGTDYEDGPLVAVAVAPAGESALTVRARLNGVFGAASTDALDAVEVA